LLLKVVALGLVIEAHGEIALAGLRRTVTRCGHAANPKPWRGHPEERELSPGALATAPSPPNGFEVSGRGSNPAVARAQGVAPSTRT